jgi:hypothetical protein
VREFCLITPLAWTPLSLHWTLTKLVVRLCCANTLPQTWPGLEAKFGLEVNEGSFWHGFGKYISNLITGVYMSGDKMSKCNSFSYKMIVQLNMFTAGMEYWINCQVKCTEVVTIKYWSRFEWDVQIFEKKGQPSNFGCSVSHGPLLSFSAWAGDCMLFLWTPRDYIFFRERCSSQ